MGREQQLNTVASGPHTAILCLILLLIAAAGWLALHSSAPPVPQASSSGLLIGIFAAELGLLYYVWAGVRRRGLGLRDLAIQGKVTARRLLIDVAVGIALFLLLSAVSALLARWIGAGNTASVKPLIGAATAQPLLWIILSLTAAVSEELTYRGYLQLQLGAWLRNPLLAIGAQAVLFGVTHGYQGVTLVLRIAMLGLIFGLAAWARNSRIPGIVAHFGLDLAGGFRWFG